MPGVLRPFKHLFLALLKGPPVRISAHSLLPSGAPFLSQYQCYKPDPSGFLYNACDFCLNPVTGLQVILTQVLIKVKRLSFLSQMNLPWADSNFSTDSFHLGLLEGAWKELAWEGRSRNHGGGSAQQGRYREAAAHREESLRAAQPPWGLVCAGLQQVLGLNVLGTKHRPSLHRLLLLGDNRLRKQRLAWGCGSQSRVPAGHGRAVRGHMKEERRQRLNGEGWGNPRENCREKWRCSSWPRGT